jgi:predicted nucleic acid-binding protein
LFADRLPKNGRDFIKNTINDDFTISVVVEIEALTYHETPHKMPLIEEFIALATILPLDRNITKKAIELRREQRKLKLGDAIIAATALVHERTLVTNNVKDFKSIEGLRIIDPHTL